MTRSQFQCFDSYQFISKKIDFNFIDKTRVKENKFKEIKKSQLSQYNIIRQRVIHNLCFF